MRKNQRWRSRYFNAGPLKFLYLPKLLHKLSELSRSNRKFFLDLHFFITSLFSINIYIFFALLGKRGWANNIHWLFFGLGIHYLWSSGSFHAWTRSRRTQGPYVKGFSSSYKMYFYEIWTFGYNSKTWCYLYFTDQYYQWENFCIYVVLVLFPCNYYSLQLSIWFIVSIKYCMYTVFMPIKGAPMIQKFTTG